MNRAPVAKKVLQYLAHAEGICFSGGGKYRTYWKKASYALCFGYLESGKFTSIQNIAAQDVHWYVINVRAYARIGTYGVGSSVVCSDVKAIPEPQIAEQQDSSPAFLLY